MITRNTQGEQNLYSQAKNAALTLMRHYRHGAYRVIIDPEGVISLWAIEGSPNAPFSISFADKGRVYNRIDDVPDHVLKIFIEYVEVCSMNVRVRQAKRERNGKRSI